MMHKLTQEAEDFLNELGETLKLPCENRNYHVWLADCIKEFRSLDSVISNYAETAMRMMEVMGRLSEPDQTGNNDTANAFHELHSKLGELVLKTKFIRT
jgi:hypothetical protein